MKNVYLKEISWQMETAKKIETKFNDQTIINHIYVSAILNMCIKYEAFIADQYNHIFNVSHRYNHPWANTRDIAKKLKIDVKSEYKVAHDLWDYYNSLKHINDQTTDEKEKIVNKYNLNSVKEVAELVYISLTNLVEKLI